MTDEQKDIEMIECVIIALFDNPYQWDIKFKNAKYEYPQAAMTRLLHSLQIEGVIDYNDINGYWLTPKGMTIRRTGNWTAYLKREKNLADKIPLEIKSLQRTNFWFIPLAIVSIIGALGGVKDVYQWVKSESTEQHLSQPTQQIDTTKIEVLPIVHPDTTNPKLDTPTPTPP